jgi:putative ABC transport system permease protein
MSTAGHRVRTAWSALTGTGAAASIALALLVLACTFIAVAVPRASLGSRTRALQRLFATTGPAERSVLGGASFTDYTFASTVLSPDLAFSRRAIAAGLRGTGLPLAPPAADWSGLTTGSTGVQDRLAGSVPVQVELAYRDALSQNSRLIAGALPVTAGRAGGQPTFQVAVTSATAARFRLHVGSRVHLLGQITLAVTGIIGPVRPGSAFWTIDPLVAAPRLTVLSPRSGLPTLDAGVFVGPAELTMVESTFSTGLMQLSWVFPLDLGQVNADQAAQLRDKLIGAVSLSGSLAGGGGGVSLTSGLSSPLATFIGTDTDLGGVLSLLFVSLTAIGLIVIVLGARLLTEHRSAEFAVLQARGASARQLAWLALRAGAVVVLPAAVLAAAVAVAVTPGPSTPLAWWLAAVTVAVALAGPPVLAVRRYRAVRGSSRRRQTTDRRIAAARRWVSDVALVCAAAGSLIVLREQGVRGPGGVDLYTSAAPILAAIPAAIIVMRLYPVTLRWLLTLAGRGRGVTGFVGLARGARSALSAVLPAFALVLALALIAFGAMVRGAVEGSDVAASWQLTGGDAVVQAPAAGAGITPAIRRTLAAVPGVQRTAPVWLATASAAEGVTLPVAAIDPGQYAAAVAGTQAPHFPAGILARPAAGLGTAGVVPALASPSAVTLLGRATTTLAVGGRTLTTRPAAIVDSFAALPDGAFLVLPKWAVGAGLLAPGALVVIGQHLDGKALRAAARRVLPGGSVTLRSQVLSSLTSAPLPRGGYVALAQGAAAAAGFSVLILLLSLVLGARSRDLTVARLSTMGLGRAQARRLAIVEAVPAILAATIGGTACALALVPLLGQSINLSAFTESLANVPVRADAAAVAASAAGLLLLALLTVSIQAFLASRRGAARALRSGE